MKLVEPSELCLILYHDLYTHECPSLLTADRPSAEPGAMYEPPAQAAPRTPPGGDVHHHCHRPARRGSLSSMVGTFEQARRDRQRPAHGRRTADSHAVFFLP